MKRHFPILFGLACACFLIAAAFVQSQPASPPTPLVSAVMTDTNGAVIPADFFIINSNLVNDVIRPGAGVTGAVVTVFGRDGAVVATLGDYEADLVSWAGAAPTNYTPGSATLEGHILGIDNALGSVSGAISDGDKGDITVSGSGATWTIDNGVVQNENLGGDITTAGKALLDDVDNAAQRTTLGLGTAAVEASTAFAAASHAHAGEDITSGTVADARIASTIARDSEVISAIDTHQALNLYQRTNSALTQISDITGNATGDLLYYTGGSWARIARGSNGQVLKSSSTTVLWGEDQTGGGGVSDGDKGDITVSSSGATWTVDNGVISTNKWTDAAHEFVSTHLTEDEASILYQQTNAALTALSANPQLYQATNVALTALASNPQLYQATNINLTALAADPQIYQATNATLTSLGALGNGIVAKTGAGALSARTITGDSEIVVGNGDGVSGNPTLSIAASITRDSELASYAPLSSPTLTTPTFNTSITGGADAFIVLDEHASAPSTAASGTVRVYAKADGKVYRKDDAGTEAELGGSGSSLITAVSTDFEVSSGTLSLTNAVGTGAFVRESEAGGGGGGTKTIAVLLPTGYQQPSANYGTFWTRNSRPVLEFDDTTDESIIWHRIIPEAAVLTSGIKARVNFVGKTATSGNVRICGQIESGTTNTDTDSFDTATCVTAAANGTSGIITTAEITLTSIDSLAAGGPFWFNFYRDANDGADTMTGDMQVYSIELRTAN
jgi:hypothetical protein